ncbi:MAG: penicillin-binding protein 1C [Salinivirgaceae bacterium]|jgi:penicillin-binding protein 1C|nr:penicillin-binding protein 1C [Bacteroidales bacterium]
MKRFLDTLKRGLANYKELSVRKKLLLLGIVLLLLFVISLFFNSIRFSSPWSPVLYDSKGNLISAALAEDNQFRFFPSDSVPEKLKTCIEVFEDKRFRSHIGVDIRALGRALYQNISNRKVVSGASTITMQVVRISKGVGKRTVWVKFKELYEAVRLDLHLSKDSILTLWATHAPFGGNVVGYEAAAWRYFGRSADNLSWAEAATLAVLPNAPALIIPGKNSEKLKEKRDRLLVKLAKLGIIDETTAELSFDEPVPQSIYTFPETGRWLLQSHSKLTGQNPYKKVNTTIDSYLQERVSTIVRSYSAQYKQTNIHNIAVLVMETKSGNVLAYIGNSTLKGAENQWVDNISALRSPGSTLKPILYASMVGRGELLPKMLVPDYPTNIDGYLPRNFDGLWNGALPADDALCRSVNVPFVRLLQQHGIAQFNTTLKKMGITTLTKSPGHYGLSIILGGAETTLWETTGVYASLGRILLNYSENSGRYDKLDIHAPLLYSTETYPIYSETEDYPISPSGIWAAFEALQKPERPDIERGWEYFPSSRRVAWKTGTSFGFRDAWAIGTDPEYTVGVWVGNSSGVSASGLLGISKAAPVLFEVFAILPKAESWFPQPHDHLTEVAVCSKSGFLPSEYCPEIDTIYTSDVEFVTGKCPYHKPVYLTADRKYRTTPEYSNQRVDTVWFSLPPIISRYYKRRNLLYQPLPKFDPKITVTLNKQNLKIIYPDRNSKIHIPTEIDGKQGKVLFEVAHTDNAVSVFWYIDSELVATTQYEHKLQVLLPQGQHELTVIGEDGSIDETMFYISLSKSEN